MSASSSINGNSWECGSRQNIKNLAKWDINQTLKWLRRSGFSDCERYFAEHKINGRALLMLDEDDMKEVVRDNVGQRKNLYHLIRTIQMRYHNFIQSSSIENDLEDEEKEEDDDDDHEEEKSKDECERDQDSHADDEADENEYFGDTKKSRSDKKKTNKESSLDIDDEDETKTSDDGTERLLKNSSFIRNKVKLGAGLGLRNRGTNCFFLSILNIKTH